MKSAQERVLREILNTQADSRFGQQFDFQSLHRDRESVKRFRNTLPLTDYETLRPAVERLCQGEQGELTTEPVQMLEPTGGSSGGNKLIPYTQLLRTQFYRGIAVWIGDLFEHRPELMKGRGYWSISPNLSRQGLEACRLPIGFDDDTGYLKGLGRYLIPFLLVGDPGLARITSLEDFRYATLRYLLEAEDLTLMSVWSPTFLTSLLAELNQCQDRLVEDVRSGSWKGISTRLPSRRPNHRRANQLREHLGCGEVSSEQLRALWPQLGLISCWADGASARQVPALSKWFPSIEIQPKGLLATECFVSVPLTNQVAPALSLNSHFFEFQPVDSAAAALEGETYLAHELDQHASYKVIVTTGGGLYRYQLHDVVRVEGFLHQCPLLRFEGRGSSTSDLVGEKLSERHVSTVLDQALSDLKIDADFAMLAPMDSVPPRYCLYLQATGVSLDKDGLCRLAARLDTSLGSNPHYRYALQLNQLGPMAIQWLDSADQSATARYLAQCEKLGQKRGDIKLAAIDSRTGWDQVFEPILARRYES